jgi:hypothetical protein
MKKTLFIITVLLLISSCEKEPENLTTNINIKLSDDVSPVKAKFYIDHKVAYTEWLINDILVIGNGGFPKDYELDYIFQEPGIYNIELNADTYNSSTKINGFKEISIPEKANRLEIIGFDLNNHDLNITDDEIIIEFYYFNGTVVKTFEKNVSVSTIGETIDFTSNLTLEISNIELSDENHYLHFYIKGLTTDTVYFNGTFWLHGGYFSDRLYNDSDKYRVSDSNGIGDIFLILDWYYE